MKLYQMADAVRYSRMTTSELRETFLLEGLFKPGLIECAYVDLDRTVIGSAVPTTSPLKLETYPELRADFFLERREIGILNVGGAGSVIADGTTYELSKLSCCYVGRGVKDVQFVSADAENPAYFYLLSYPAHKEFPTAMVKFEELQGLALGSSETCNQRTIYKTIFKDGIKSCQLVMGFTLLAPGSNWNTMPPHTHMRRSEVYFYFDIDPAHRVMHLMGPTDETKHLIVADKEVVVSPGWSIHAGVGTKNYTFCWGMGGENQEYTDMDAASIAELK
ncbi:4-deoxy-L-threo-5-hexosulose-uronate ketol-isomerase [Granulicella pectinivorans]|uniref:4-deoxy-L-threo-5-hexosulose-uronate ketol-isomerase n=1 Tax=Granulicella pectinivorans TaxID=474950 RepID=A0A1I6MSD0_9BACT|nr:5-dehydro-4-deoxy-D-glucuronate isomerase [Granulicella pectinivorans]SFS18653.1 4-deoxy-L-threo-5-hexosulose-uronate ketol-isomerase [Granulicella pectinivorans]